MDAPVTKSDLDAAIERLEGLIHAEGQRLEGFVREEVGRAEERLTSRILEAELRLSRQLSRYLGGLSIALVATFVAAAIAIVAGT